MGGFPGAPSPGPFLLFSACKQTQPVLVISPPINKNLPWAASGLLTAPVWIREQRKSRRSVFFQKLLGKNYRAFVGNKSSQQMPGGNQTPGISCGGANGGVGSQGWAAKGGQPRGSTSSHGRARIESEQRKALGSWGAVCSSPALAQAQLFSLTELPWALVPRLEFQPVFKDWLLQPAPALFSNTCLELAQESRPEAGSFSGFSIQPA